MDWRSRIRNAFGTNGPDEEVVEELAQHAAALYAAARAEGTPEADAERQIAGQIDAWVQERARLKRRPRTAAMVEPPSTARGLTLIPDVRYALRLLRRQPGFAALVVLTMALGIGATTVLASVAYGVLLKPLPWRDADHLVRLYESRQGSTHRFAPLMTNGTYLAWRDQHTTIDDMAAWSGSSAVLTGAGTAERIRTAAITPNLLSVLGVGPVIGHAFDDGDELPGHTPTALLSYGMWQRRFGGRADVVGRTVTLDGKTSTIVGVMPRTFVFPDDDTRVWTPFYIEPTTVSGQKGYSLSLFNAVARLRPGVTPRQAAAEGTTRGNSVPQTQNGKVTAMAVFGSDGPVEVTVTPMLDAITGEVKPAILIFLAAVALLLLTATANVASLQLARATARKRELAIRAALGAGARRLMRQTLVENMLLGVAGGIAGLALAAWMQHALPALLPADFPRVDDLTLDVRVQVFAVALSLLAGIGFGLFPAWQARRADLVSSLKDDAQAPVGAGFRSPTARARAIIMTGQVAIACVLLLGAALMIRSFNRMMHANVGFEVGNVLTARIALPDASYSAARREQTLNALVDRLQQVPGVQHAAYTLTLPFVPGEMLSSFPLKKRDGTTVQVQTGMHLVSADYFAALGQRIVEGRGFTRADLSHTGTVAIVNLAFARRYLDGRALGAHLPGVKDPKGVRVPKEIIGVADDTARHAITDPPQPEIFQLPPSDKGIIDSDVYFTLRTSVDPTTVIPMLRSVVHQADAEAPLDSIATLDGRVSQSLARPHLYAVLLGTFALFALAIAGVGLFGVLSYSVAQRAREIGVRAALGATPAAIVRLVAAQCLVIAGTGLAVGLVASAWVARGLASFLYGITPHDTASYVVVGLVLLVMAAIASIVPARRAARVDPVTVLKG